MRPHIAGAVASATVLASVAAIAALPSSAGAYSASCASDNESGAAGFVSSRKEINEVSVGTNKKVSSEQLRYRGTLKNGNHYDSEISCTVEGSRIKTITVSLGDGDDSARADGKGLQGGSGYGATDPSVDVVFRGGAGDDKLIGNSGGGILRGGGGNDTIRDHGGSDVIKGGAGNDTINAKDGTRDVIDCGGGNDSVVADSFDITHDCR